MRLQVTIALILGTTAAAASAQTPADIQDLVGARGAGGETQMQARGYTNVGGETGDDRVWTYWWNPTTRTCVTVATKDGRYDSITTSPAPDCQRHSEPATQAPASQPQSQAGGHWFDIGLICFGEGQRPAAATRYGYTWDAEKGRYIYGNSTELTTQDFDASVTIQLWDDGGRIRLPEKLVPPIHSRGEDGWWELDNVSTGQNVITASYHLNGLNKPKITIDRGTGRISVRGSGDYAFNGVCDRAGSQERRF
ncbi:MAG: hypothetical protein J7493_16330 [Porphyrobacter sp.]|nr:hypothetical protein [Porphyrobacter sp.]